MKPAGRLLVIDRERRAAGSRSLGAEDPLVLGLEMLQGLAEVDNQEPEIELLAAKLSRKERVRRRRGQQADRIGRLDGPALLLGVENPAPFPLVRM